MIDGHTDFVSQGTCGTGKVFVLYLKNRTIVTCARTMPRKENV